MLKKLKKTLSEEFKKRYDKMESHYLGLENRIFTTIEQRIDVLEEKLEELSALFKEELQTRKAKNQGKMDALDLDEDHTKDNMDELKAAISQKVSETKERVAKEAKKVQSKVNTTVKQAATKAKDAATKLKNAQKKSNSKTKEDDLTQLKGIGEKMAMALKSEGIKSFKDLAGLTDSKIQSLNANIKGFAASCKRNDWINAAKKMLKG
jgi:predicted flap endonuclease-1-like 5' DNA nuclease